MKTQALLLLTIAAFAGAANAATRNDASAYGQAVPSDAAGRTISLTSQTRSVNVTNGETVTFKKDGRSFTWHVDTCNNVSAFALAVIAPATLHAGGVEVYVASNDYYQQ